MGLEESGCIGGREYPKLGCMDSPRVGARARGCQVLRFSFSRNGLRGRNRSLSTQGGCINPAHAFTGSSEALHRGISVEGEGRQEVPRH
jgi:hypothetical protein